MAIKYVQEKAGTQPPTLFPEEFFSFLSLGSLTCNLSMTTSGLFLAFQVSSIHGLRLADLTASIVRVMLIIG